MRLLKLLVVGIVFLSAVSPLNAGDFILYGGFQKPGKIAFTSATAVPSDLLNGEFGGTLGARFSAGRIVGFEQNISFSPRYAKPGLKAFQMDSNLLVQAPGKIVPYATAGLGFVKTWGKDFPSSLDPAQIAAFAFNFGTKFSVNYGGGIKVRRILGPLGFNVDLRGYTVPDVHDGKLNFIQTSFGAVLSW
jgi:hypothetical protein